MVRRSLARRVFGKPQITKAYRVTALGRIGVFFSFEPRITTKKNFSAFKKKFTWLIPTACTPGASVDSWLVRRKIL
jgi:hypothetical protein